MTRVLQRYQSLPEGFRKLGAAKRRDMWEARFLVGQDERDAVVTGDAALELADLMVEGAVGVTPLPLGIAQGFLIDGIKVDVPMAVEEPSVIAAAGYAAYIISKSGGFQTEADEPVMETCVYLEKVSAAGEGRLRGSDPMVRQVLSALQASLEKRGGGYRNMQVDRLAGTGLVAVALSMDVRDAMGANILNTAAEAVTPLLEEISGGKALMGILSNAAEQRMARASFSLPFELLEPYCGKFSADEIARRIELAFRVADEDPRRAVTHNKGIMNGIAALAQATMNDTRAVEAAVHAWSARTGSVRPLSRFESINAIGTAIPGEIHASWEPDETPLTLNAPADFAPIVEKAFLAVASALSAASDSGASYQGASRPIATIPGGRLVVTGTIPPGSGFGSSAALCVALARTVAQFHAASACPVSEALIWTAANEAERLFHGRPSGVDTGLSMLQTGSRGFRSSKTIGQTKISTPTGDLLLLTPGAFFPPVTQNLPSAGIHIVYGSTPRVSSCAANIAAIGKGMAENDARIRDAIAELGSIAGIAGKALLQGTCTPAQLGKLAGQAMNILSLLGLSTPMLDDLLTTGMEAGATGGKLSGGGGGGAFWLAAADAVSAQNIRQAVSDRAHHLPIPGRAWVGHLAV